MFKQELEKVVIANAIIPELPAMYDAELVVEKEASRKEGFDAGVASVSAPGDKVYTQEDMDAALATFKGELDAAKLEIESAKAETETVRAESEAKALEAVVAYKVGFKEIYTRNQASENTLEAEVLDYLN